MKSFRECLPVDFLRRMERELGREESLRLLWPVVVGQPLAGNTQLKSVRGGMLIVSVPDRTWRGSLGSMEKMILAAVNRFWGEEVCRSIEFREDPRLPVPLQEPRPGRPRTPRELLPADLPAAKAITDDELRERILESIRKYFSWQEGIRR